MLMISFDQIPLDVGMQRCLFVWIFLRFLEDNTGAYSAQEISDQHASQPVHKTVDWQPVCPFDLHHADRPRQTAGTQIPIIEPERFDGVAKLCPRLFEHKAEHLFGSDLAIVFCFLRTPRTHHTPNLSNTYSQFLFAVRLWNMDRLFLAQLQ